jgi:hypothetical protein
MHSRIRVVLGVAAVALSATAGANAEEAPRLEYVVGEGTPSCPSEREFRDAVAARLGHDPFASASSRSLRVNVGLEGGELAATGALVEADGRAARLRRITRGASDCREVVDGMALAVSLAVSLSPDELAATEPDDPPAIVAPSAPAEKPVPKTAPSTPTERRVDAGARKSDDTAANGEHFDFGGGVVAHATLGVGPGVGAGASVFLVGRLAPWSLSVEGRFDGLSTGMSFEQGGSATTTLLAGVLAPCRSFAPFSACALGLAGRIAAESTGVSPPNSDAAPYAAAGGRLGFEWPWSRSVLLTARFDLLVTLLSVDMKLGDETVWSSPPVSALLGAGVVGLLP